MEFTEAIEDNWTSAPQPPLIVDYTAYKWCKEHPSTGKFYNHHDNFTAWSFEHKADALMFMLRWGC